ncbi:hypothetical protein GCM10009127_03260 [Alteraurantiacibacter aestuarii]|uniref:Lasso RiPP family leader peptide-containing protein n=1 Tax=Alteraurantiacibacter aestuarii TaxID=650004 RepID=A0A844ZN11_9SPHN|nr:lasso RiPP family leader peptide-containing protein [Alteraurantiacibacter aestuarii]MXO88420.1 lasso RiPP family leader peptide-containing protein [Alteraurantiacibacter aestuarii]
MAHNGVTGESMKKAYAAPALTEFGSVRNLTGGSGGSNPDFGGMRMVVFVPPM